MFDKFKSTLPKGLPKSAYLELPQAIPMKNSKKKVAAGTLTVAILFALSHCVGSSLLDRTPPQASLLTPEISTTPDASAETLPPLAVAPPIQAVQTTLAPDPDKAASAPVEIATPQLAMPILYAGNLGTLTNLKAQLEEARLRVALAEQQQRLRQLEAPEPAVVSPELLAALTPPGGNGGSSGVASESKPVQVSVRLVSVQSAGANKSATVNTSGGTVVLRPGDAFLASKVQHITDDAVILASGRRIGWE